MIFILPGEKHTNFLRKKWSVCWAECIIAVAGEIEKELARG